VDYENKKKKFTASWVCDLRPNSVMLSRIYYIQVTCDLRNYIEITKLYVFMGFNMTKKSISIYCDLRMYLQDKIGGRKV
jgi:hypothetical protein